MIILGLNAYFHDSAAALVIDGQVVAAAQEERFTGQKHDASLPVEAVRFCLEQAGIGISDVDEVVFYEKPLLKFERLMVSHLRNFPRGFTQFSRAMRKWLGSRLWLKGQLAQELGCDPDCIRFSTHHLSHAASAFFTSPYEQAAVITADGVGEWTTTAIYKGKMGPEGHSLELVKELHYPHSIGLLYSALTAYLGFRVNNGEYKVMGLASYGQPIYLSAFEKMARIGEDASLELDLSYFSFHHHHARSFSDAMVELLGPARVPGSPLLVQFGDEESQRFADIAASLQAFTERYMMALVDEAKRVTGEENLCMAGGVALNSVANDRIRTQGPFSSLFVHPAAGDAGGALGAALYQSHVVHQIDRAEPMGHAFLGKGYSQQDVAQFLTDCRIRYQAFDDDESLHEEMVKRLSEGDVGAYFHGRFEWGPRALGGRTILADPSRPDMTDKVNRRIKFREAFRPFAPMVLDEEMDRLFKNPGGRDDHLSPYMLGVSPVTDEGKRLLPATTHVDGTARVQRVDPSTNGKVYALLKAFQRQTGVGALMNTSLNVKGEPPAASPGDAYSVFHRSGLDFLVMERCLVEKRGAELQS
jgi:carbamoyltransferase